jgi:hypothetical protein
VLAEAASASAIGSRPISAAGRAVVLTLMMFSLLIDCIQLRDIIIE